MGYRRGSRGQIYEGRVVRVEFGARSFQFDPNKDRSKNHDPIPELTSLMKSYSDLEFIPLAIFPRKGITYGDIVPLLDLAAPLGLEKVQFSGSFENE